MKPSHAPSREDARRDAESRRGSASERGYDGRWRKARVVFLDGNPLCVMCAAKGRVTLASVVDHVVPHRGDYELFWDEANWQSLCKPCHDGDKQASERRRH